jgi:hypothetical protein
MIYPTAGRPTVLDNLTDPQLVQFLAFCGHQIFIALFTTARPLVAKLNQIRPIQYLPLYQYNAAFHITLTTTTFEMALFLHILRLIKILTPSSCLPFLLHVPPISSCDPTQPNTFHCGVGSS